MAGQPAKRSKNVRRLLELRRRRDLALLVVARWAAKIRIKADQVQADERKKERQILKFGAPVVARAGPKRKYIGWRQQCIYRGMRKNCGAKHTVSLCAKTKRRLSGKGNEALLSRI